MICGVEHDAREKAFESKYVMHLKSVGDRLAMGSVLCFQKERKCRMVMWHEYVMSVEPT
jgi:hypothetical protein